MVFSNAGHNPPLLMRANGTAEWLDEGGTVLGIMPMIRYEQATCRLEPGDVLVIFSDGVTDACDPQGDDFGEARLAAVIAEHRHEGSVEIVQAVNRKISEFTAGTPLPDDLTLLVARRTG